MRQRKLQQTADGDALETMAVVLQELTDLLAGSGAFQADEQSFDALQVATRRELRGVRKPANVDVRLPLPCASELSQLRDASGAWLLAVANRFAERLPGQLELGRTALQREGHAFQPAVRGDDAE